MNEKKHVSKVNYIIFQIRFEGFMLVAQGANMLKRPKDFQLRGSSNICRKMVKRMTIRRRRPSKHPMATFQPLMIPILPLQVIVTIKDTVIKVYFPYFLCWEPKANITDPVVCPDCNIEDSPSSNMRKEIAEHIRSVFCFRIQIFQGLF